jgi:hypothetical protein
VKIDELNLEDLRSQYERQDSIREAQSIVTRFSDPKLRTLLRYHIPNGVEGDDIERRDAFDQLLEYYSLMEVACIASYVPNKMPPDYVRDATVMLSNPAVRVYYEKHYPLLLPQLHLRRLLSTWDARERNTRLPASFSAFAELSRVLYDADVEMFLWFLEDGSYEGTSIEDLLGLIQDSERFAEAVLEETTGSEYDEAPLWETLKADALANPAALVERVRVATKKDDGPVKQALRGFQKFLFFSHDLHRLLQAMGDVPLTRAAMWHHHAYWFDSMGDVLRPYLHDAIDRFTTWSAVDDAEVANDRGRAVGELRQAINALTSGKYGEALRVAATAIPMRKFMMTPGVRRRAIPMSAAALGAAPTARSVGTKRVSAKQPAAKKLASAKQRTRAMKFASAKKKLARKTGATKKAVVKKAGMKRGATKVNAIRKSAIKKGAIKKSAMKKIGAMKKASI